MNTLLNGKKYIPAHQTDISKLWPWLKSENKLRRAKRAKAAKKRIKKYPLTFRPHR